jgi:signal peptidase II
VGFYSGGRPGKRFRAKGGPGHFRRDFDKFGVYYWKTGGHAMKRKYLILLAVTSVVIVLDQLTKYSIVDKFRLGESIPVIWNFFNITYVQNTGAAFGLLSHANPAFRIPFFIIVPLVALCSIAYVFRKVPDRDLNLALALSLVISGAVGNLIDRLSLGYVVDFLDFHWHGGYHFPAFNVADSAICTGVGLIMLDLIIQENNVAPKKKKSRAHVS